MDIILSNLQKILGVASAMVGAAVSFAAAGGASELFNDAAIQLLGLTNVVLGAATAASGFNTSAQVKIAEAMQSAIKATPGDTNA